MRLLISIILIICSFCAMASSNCDANRYLRSLEGKDKLSSLLERSKSLIISKLEDIGIEEDQVNVKAIFPKSFDDLNSSLLVEIKSKNLTARNSRIILTKKIIEEDCGLEISIYGGQIMNSASGKNFGSLGKVKEFIKL